MTKFSNFIRNLGTAGPATLQGIYDLGFALRSEWPGVLAKYVRVDAAQSFTSGEQLQGRENIGAGTIATQDADAVAITGGSIAGITDLAVVDGGTGASSAPAARTNLGLGNVDNTSDANKPVSTATQTALNLKANLASPALTGTPTAPTATLGTNTTQVATTAFVIANASAITRFYESPEQTITSAGALTLAHGMGVEPKLLQALLVCKTAEFGYSVNDKVFINPHQQSPGATEQQGISVVPDATNLNVRYGLASSAFRLIIKDTGGTTPITNANWRLVLRAWA